MHLIVKHYSELTRDEVYQLLQFRQEVFIVEQNCPYLDADGKDQSSWHLWLEDGQGQMIAYCRILPKGISYDEYSSIGRVISRQSHRATGAGRRLMTEALDWLQQTWPDIPVKISAQCYLESFYTSLGFMGIGDTYMEDDIPHRAMILKH